MFLFFFLSLLSDTQNKSADRERGQCTTGRAVKPSPKIQLDLKLLSACETCRVQSVPQARAEVQLLPPPPPLTPLPPPLLYFLLLHLSSSSSSSRAPTFPFSLLLLSLHLPTATTRQLQQQPAQRVLLKVIIKHFLMAIHHCQIIGKKKPV